MNEFRRRMMKGRIRLLLLRALGLCAGALLFSQAQAQSVLCRSLGNETRSMPLQAGTLSAGPDVPLGSVVYAQRFERAAGSILSCTGEARRVLNSTGNGTVLVQPQFSPRYTFEYNATPLPLSGWNQGPYGGKIYQTDVPGLGVTVVRGNVPAVTSAAVFPSSATEASQCSQSSATGFSSSCTLNFGDNLSFKLLFIKIGNISPGVIVASSLPTPVMRIQVSNADPVSVIVPITGSISMLSSTCRTPDVAVEMGQHSVGTMADSPATPWKDFAIRLLGCPGFTGTFTEAGPVWTAPPASSNDNRLSLANTRVPGRFTQAGTTPSTLSFRIDPIVAPVDAASGVLSLDAAPAGSSASATGVGIQISNNAGGLLGLGEIHPSGLRLQSSAQSYSIPLRARYLRSDAPLAPGPATASATFMIIYH
ncbi:type 1 fimbrial protein [Stenotrophomonas maltophilia]|nr:type 1 fimbrial protein [Stenotrophomonas maltophilia]